MYTFASFSYNKGCSTLPTDYVENCFNWLDVLENCIMQLTTVIGG